MKTKLFFLLIAFNTLYLSAQCTGNVNIPDANFKAALVADTSINTDSNTEISCAEAIAYTGVMNIRRKSIEDLTGIEAFINLTHLNCESNELNTIDISNNINLIYLYCSDNSSMTSLDVTKNTALKFLYCNSNPIPNLDITKNTALNKLSCYDNNLTSLDVSKNTALTDLLCGYNNISSLDITNNTDLTYLNCDYNSLTNLDVSKNTALTHLLCVNNSLTSLDLANNPDLTYLKCNTTNLTSLNLDNNTKLGELYCTNNNLTDLNLSNNVALKRLSASNNTLTNLNVANEYNTEFTSFTVLNNPNLRCIEVDDINYSTTNWSNVDATTSFSTDCSETFTLTQNATNGTITANIPPINGTYTTGTILELTATPDEGYQFDGWSGDATGTTNPLNITMDTDKSVTATFSCFVNIPDANFKAALVANTSINTDSDTEISCDEAIAFNGTINVNNKSITDLTGIEAFVNILELFCENNDLTSLNVDNNTALTRLWCYSNNLTSLNVDNNTTLTRLNCRSNELTSLNVTNNNSLIYLHCYFNDLTNLDVTNNIVLSNLNCSDNTLTNLNVANGNNTNFTIFSAEDNLNLSCIQVDDVAYSNANWTIIDSATSFSTDCSAVLNITDNTFNNEISIYPNPVMETLTINLNTSGQLEKVQVFTLLGKQVIETTTTAINVSDLSAGIYLLKAENNAGLIGTKKFVKQ